MKKKLIAGTITLLILVLMLTLSIKASIFSTIGMKGLSFASPESAQLVQTVICASNPASCAAGYLTGQVSGELMQEVAKESPEVGKAIQQYNQVKGWVDEGAQISEDLKLNENAELAGGSLTLNDKERDLSSLINSEAEEGSIKAANMEVTSKGEGADVSFTAKEGGYLEINGKRYENLKEGSTIIADREGNVKEADITLTKGTTIELGGKKIQAEKDMRVVYKNGVLEVYGKDQTVEIDKQKIQIKGEGGIKVDGQKIMGEDFTIDEKRFTGIGEGLAEVTVIDKGYVLGKNTMMEDDRMIIISEKGDVLYSKMCGDVSGFGNYVNPCSRTLTIEGDVSSVLLKEGKHFGLDIKKDDVFSYNLEGGKVVLNNGEQKITTTRGDVTVQNGVVITRYTTIEGTTHILVDPNTVGSPDVDVTTVHSDMVTIENSQTGSETVYVCPVSTRGTGAITGAFSLLDKCYQALGINTKGDISESPQVESLEENSKSIIEKQEDLEKVAEKVPLPNIKTAKHAIITSRARAEGWDKAGDLSNAYSNAVNNPSTENTQTFLELENEYLDWRKNQ